MTQPLPTDVPLAVPVPTQAPAAPIPAISIGDRVLEASDLGATIAEAKVIQGQLRRFYKFNFGDKAWEVGQPIPGNEELTIFAAFNTDFLSKDTDGLSYVAGDCRFYVIPTDGKLPDPLAEIFLCYTVNRSSPTLVAEKMSLETFIREVGTEWFNLAVVQNIIEEEDEEEEG